MKRIAVLLVLILALTCICCSCETKYTWDDALVDIEKIKDAQFVVYIEDTQEQLAEFSEILNWEIGREGLDPVELTHITSLHENLSVIVSFQEFATEQQAEQMYDYYHNVSNQQKLVRFGNIIISTNSDTAQEILGYDFI